jgi:hypothetical protein
MASVRIVGQGRQAYLTREGVIVRAILLSPANATFQFGVKDPTPLGLGENSNAAFTKLIVKLPEMTRSTTIAVQFKINDENVKYYPDLPIVPIELWPATTIPPPPPPSPPNPPFPPNPPHPEDPPFPPMDVGPMHMRVV